MTLRIQCPACQRQFKIDEELKGRTVECGACENQFVVDENAIVPERDRYFPGDIKKTGLDHYGRAPTSGGPAPPVHFATATYDEHASAADVTPASPQRMFATTLGICLQVIFVIVLLFGSQENGLLKDMEHGKRVVLAGFMAAVGGALILYGNYRRKREAFAVIMVLGTLVVGLALFLPVPKILEDFGGVTGTPGAAATDDSEEEPVPRKMTEDEAIQAMGYDQVEKAFANFSRETVVALWVPSMKLRFKYQIQRYLHRKTGTGARPSFFTRGDGGLIVIEGTRLGMPEIEAIVERFARVDEVFPNLRVLKITIEGDRLLEPSPELDRKLKDKTHPSFYAYNQSELDHIDIDRVQEAARRLATVEPLRFRPQIAKRLVELLQEDNDSEFRSTICDAITVWSEPGDNAEQAVAQVAQDLLIGEDQVPRSMIEFLMERRAPEVVAILELLWKKDTSTWEPLLVDLGTEAEGMVVAHLSDEDSKVQRSAIVILGRIGSRDSLPALREVLQKGAASGDNDRKVLLEAAISAIEAR